MKSKGRWRKKKPSTINGNKQNDQIEKYHEHHPYVANMTTIIKYTIPKHQENILNINLFAFARVGVFFALPEIGILLLWDVLCVCCFFYGGKMILHPPHLFLHILSVLSFYHRRRRRFVLRAYFRGSHPKRSVTATGASTWGVLTCIFN